MQAAWPAHPRLRGADAGFKHGSQSEVGSSPLTRGGLKRGSSFIS
ncbi:hypothetical protein HMPREF0308_0803 [Corynebacterium striatum ATCC 6940]|nr:hypothetical protein HMPREF0308_0803 [Corynebacterium striatum ATCC 6940]